MQLQAKAGTQYLSLDDSNAGEGLAIFASQDTTDVARYRVIVKAITDQNTLTVGEFFISPPSATNPGGQPSRLVGVAMCPGAVSWALELTCVNSAIPDETIDISLVSSKCSPSPLGVNRVGERFNYASGPGIGYNVLPGQKVKSWVATAAAAIGSVSINSNTPIVIPINTTLRGAPESDLIQTFAFTGAGLNWFIEFLESA